MKTDTAHLAWNSRWATEDGRADWLTPDMDVVELSEALLAGGKTKRVLDLGCGVGRHALHFARLGFETFAIDMADAGLSEVRSSAADAGLKITTEAAPMTALPFPDGHFDYVLSFNVIYHGDPSIVQQAVSEIRRVLKPGGTYQGTMLSKRNVNYGRGTEIAPNTFIVDNDDDKDHPHFYCNAGELVALFDGFELRTLADKQHKKPGTWHWHLSAERL
jgi:SAM-dependent methyltransferase